MYEEEFDGINSILGRLWVDANAKIVFLVDKNGQQIAAKGDSTRSTRPRLRR
jgi:hypothetical protein